MNTKGKRNKRAQVSERQAMEMARALVRSYEVPIVAALVDEATQQLFACDYDSFLGTAEQAEICCKSTEIRFLLQCALAQFPGRKVA